MNDWNPTPITRLPLSRMSLGGLAGFPGLCGVAMANDDLKAAKNSLLAQLLAPDREFQPKPNELDRLKVAYADAMWSWAHVEAEWLPAYICATNSFWAKFSPIQQSYFSIVTAKVRLDMTHAAARAAWDGRPEHQTTFDEWTLLADRSRKELAKRGRIAHLTGGYVFDIRKPPVARLVQHSWHPEFSFKYEDQKNRGISIEQLQEMFKAWNTLAADLQKFSSGLSDPIFRAEKERKAKLGAPPASDSDPSKLSEPQQTLPATKRPRKARKSSS